MPNEIKKRKHVRTSQVSPLDILRTKIWVAEVERTASRYVKQDVSLKEFSKFFVMTSADNKKYISLAQGKSVPSEATINEVAEAHPLGDRIRIFSHTKELFEVGMNGFPLWKILNGDLDACLETVDEEIASIQNGVAPDENSSFEKRVKTIFSSRLPASIDSAALWNAISDNLTQEMHVDFNVIALTAEDADEIPSLDMDGKAIADPIFLKSATGTWHNKDSIVRLNAGQVITNIALYVLSRSKKELVAQCHYMLRGVLHTAVREQFDCGTLLAEFFTRDEWKYDKLI